MSDRGVGDGVAAVVLAGGSGTRFAAAHNKSYVSLAGRRVLTWTMQTLHSLGVVSWWVLVARPQDRPVLQRTLDREIGPLGVEPDVVDGGGTRHESEYAALRHLRGPIEHGEIGQVLVHDAARPLASGRLMRELLAVAATDGAAVPGFVDDDLRSLRADGGVDFSGRADGALARCQTPQVFAARQLLQAYDLAEHDGFRGTDTAACWQQYAQQPVTMVPGDPRNLKITYPRDLFVADAVLRADFDLS